METLLPLWMPVLASAVAVFVASSLVHMVLKWHLSDQSGLANEDAVADALRGAAPGEYRLPWCATMEAMKAPAFQEKLKRGPVAVVGVYAQGDVGKAFARSLAQWFVYALVVSLLAGHVAFAVLGRTAEHDFIVHTVGLTAFAGYGLGLAQQSIWGPKKWWPTVKSMIDALVYAMLTGFIFSWLWPR
jgi:cellobiose-specific phosphotransferase system component IIC